MVLCRKIIKNKIDSLFPDDLNNKYYLQTNGYLQTTIFKSHFWLSLSYSKISGIFKIM